MSKISLAILLTTMLLFPGCTWVKLTALGEDVALVETETVEGCQKLGTTTSYVKHTIGPMDRSEETIVEELVTLAKNRAAEMGGNSIVAEGPPEEGNMRFRVYWCKH